MLELKQEQELQQKLSPQQIQYIKLLQLNTLDLDQRIKEELEEMNFTVEELNANLDTLKSEYSQLAEVNQEKESIIEEKTKELNKAYLALGTKKELEEKEMRWLELSELDS